MRVINLFRVEVDKFRKGEKSEPQVIVAGSEIVDQYYREINGFPAYWSKPAGTNLSFNGIPIYKTITLPPDGFKIY